MIDLSGCSVIVIGGASGIGAASAALAAQCGAAVVIGDIDEGGVGMAEKLARSGADVSFQPCDATDEASLNALVESVVARLGRVDGLLITVGGAHPGAVIDTDLAAWNAELRFNLTSAFLAARSVLPTMVEQQSGSIVLTSSGYAAKPGPGRVPYSAAKAGVLGFTRSLAAEMGEHGVRVNAVAPGPTATERFFELLREEEVEQVRATVPLGRLSEPDDCAAAMVFLLSERARQMTGQTLYVNGGNYMP